MTKYADRIIVAFVIACAAYAMGLQTGATNPEPVICPDKALGEQLISITINGPMTICTYAPSYGRATRRARA